MPIPKGRSCEIYRALGWGQHTRFILSNSIIGLYRYPGSLLKVRDRAATPSFRFAILTPMGHPSHSVHIDFHAQQRRRERLPQGIAAQRTRGPAIQRAVQYKVERQYVGYFETFDFPRDYAFKVGMHTFSRHFAGQQIIRRPVRSEERYVSLVALTTGTGVGQVHKLLFHISSTLTRTYSSMMERGASVGQMPSRPRGSIMPPTPPMNGGPLSPKGGMSRPSFAASFLSAQRTATRRYTSFRSSICAGSASGPWIELNPRYSMIVSSAFRPVSTICCWTICAASCAFASASGQA